ncbi:hypothetical protein [Micromonospora sp. CPCC 206061]|uniref:hypothetical protein n=1 Tax=Micromonospora sp. CPCC 206061 TaxID=3122410 RepID=UPI002FEF71DA
MIARLWNGLWLVALLVGVPAALVATVGNPLPAREQWRSLAAEPLTQDTLFGAAAVAVARPQLIGAEFVEVASPTARLVVPDPVTAWNTSGHIPPPAHCRAR